ncbi:MAG: response regulator [Clostridia bacterium]|nr:response regulator [Clostridia bacterium]
MEKRLEILLVEDDQQECKSIIDAVDNNPDDFLLIGVTNNSMRAFQHVIEAQPDAVILDLELHHGGGDGLDFLKRLKEAQLPHTPFILITTNNISMLTHEVARELGADYIMTKNQKDYSAKSVLEFLKITKSVILNRRQHVGVNVVEESPTIAAKRIKRRICTELEKVGISPKAVGQKYLVDAITITIQQPVTRISDVIGKNYRKTESSVERAMQNAINRAWKTFDVNELYANYTARIRPDKGTPTVTEFIHYYAQKIKNDF